MPTRTLEKPTSVTVFGILNIIFGGVGLLFSSFVMFGLVAAEGTAAMASAYKKWLLLMNIIGFGFSVWLFALGIGLLKLRKWARRGSVLYACLGILLSVIETGVNIFALAVNWIALPQGGLPAYVGGMCGGLVGGLVYPVLLLIFMQTAKVKQAFQSREETRPV